MGDFGFYDNCELYQEYDAEFPEMYPDEILDPSDLGEVYRKGKEQGILPNKNKRWNSREYQIEVLTEFFKYHKVLGVCDAKIPKIYDRLERLGFKVVGEYTGQGKQVIFSLIEYEE